MGDGRERDDEVDGFLRGEPERVSDVEGVIRATVRSFHLVVGDVERDLVQEALSRTLAGVASSRFLGESSLRTYARHVAKYTTLEHIRRRRREVVFDPESHPDDARWSAPEQSFLSSEQHRRNLEAFASLPEDCRRLLRLISVEGASYRDAAMRLGISEAALKSRIHRCRQACREAAKTPPAVSKRKASS